MSENLPQVQQTGTPAQIREMTVDEAVARFKMIEDLATRVLKEGSKEGTGDYGIFPGTKQKVLFKSGAEKLCTVFRLGAHYSIEVAERDPGGDHVAYTVRCTLKNQANGVDVGSALGMCSTKESKYRYRNSGRACPQCGIEAIMKSKPEYGGGWYCFAKKGGCGAKFKDGDEAIENQQPGKVENPDIADVENTVLKMAEKRAHVAATLNALGVSSLFTQDIGDDEAQEGEPQMRKQGGATKQSPKQSRAPEANEAAAPKDGQGVPSEGKPVTADWRLWAMKALDGISGGGAIGFKGGWPDVRGTVAKREGEESPRMAAIVGMAQKAYRDFGGDPSEIA